MSTGDIDLIVDLAGLHEWAMLLEDLRTKGFVKAANDDVICRMRLGRLKVDFMPDDEAILGFSNRWYATGIETAQPHILDAGIDIKVLTPPIFVATKLEAFLGRGNNDLYASRDAEDLLLMVDGREELLADEKPRKRTENWFESSCSFISAFCWIVRARILPTAW